MNTEMTDVFRFHLNLFSVSLTIGSISKAVRSAKIIGNDIGMIKMKVIEIKIIMSVILIFRVVSHFVNGYAPKLFTLSIIAKMWGID